MCPKKFELDKNAPRRDSKRKKKCKAYRAKKRAKEQAIIHSIRSYRKNSISEQTKIIPKSRSNYGVITEDDL